MQSAASAVQWFQLSEPGNRLAAARLECHHAVQLNTRFARAFAEAKDDDSHTSLSWDFERRALIGAQAGPFRLGLRIADLTLILIEAAAGTETSTFPLQGRRFTEATEWLGRKLRESGIDPGPLANPIHFELDDHPLLHGGRFEAYNHERALQGLASWYWNAAACLEAIGRPVRCWPHHFDIATQITEGERSIGVGLSPGDATYNQPYFYVTPSPYPDANRLPALRVGHWNTQGWIGAVLTSDEVLAYAGQSARVNGFLREAIELLSNVH